MKVLNHHRRRLPHPPELPGALLDTLATKEDRLWPHERWPGMAFHGPMEVGAKGGHGPIRYTVEEYEPGRRVVFRFLNPKGFLGTHAYRVEGLGKESELHHTIDMRVSGTAILTWPLVFRPLHDALLEDSLDKAEALLNGGDWQYRDWPLAVRILRWILARRGRKTR